MNHLVSPHAALNILIPFYGAAPSDRVLALAHAIGGSQPSLMLLHHGTETVTGYAEPAIAPGLGDPSGLEATEPKATATEIERVAAEQGADLILMATSCPVTGDLDPSCLAAQLALHSTIPVMLFRVEEGSATLSSPQITRLLVPLDSSIRSAQALPFSAKLAQRLNLSVHLIMIIDPSTKLPPAYAYDAEATAELVALLSDEAHGALTRAEDQLADLGVTVSSSLIQGPVIECLEAAVQPGDVLVMTTHGSGGAPKGRIGSVAARLVANNPGMLIIMRGSPPSSVIVTGHIEYLLPDSLAQ